LVESHDHPKKKLNSSEKKGGRVLVFASNEVEEKKRKTRFIKGEKEKNLHTWSCRGEERGREGRLESQRCFWSETGTEGDC